MVSRGVLEWAFGDQVLSRLAEVALGRLPLIGAIAALQKQGRYTSVIDMFLSNQSLSIPEKLRALEKEAQLLVFHGSNERANAARRQTGTCRHPNHATRRNIGLLSREP
ncbi:hypothetical protein E4U44_007986 [Claviceps purpurea]|nr:hypothetical protein E4U45_008591 [Claviceps purpurea]KAG6324997.1 hypothetical protein E4U44_007986 [Claviceps purpurea]